MAEFVEVMKQRARMCIDDDTFCHACKLNQFASRFAENCNRVLMSHSEEAEKIIMDWAKEHPVMTNADKFREVFGVNIEKGSCGCGGIEVEEKDCYGIQCKDCKQYHFWQKEWKEPKEKADDN